MTPTEPPIGKPIPSRYFDNGTRRHGNPANRLIKAIHPPQRNNLKPLVEASDELDAVQTSRKESDEETRLD